MGYYPGYTIGPILWALTISLTTFAAVWSVVAYRRRGMPGLVRGAGLMLLPLGLLLTGLLLLALRVVDAVVLWASRLAFRPTVWLGMVILAIAIVLVKAGKGPRTRPTPTPGKLATARSVKVVGSRRYVPDPDAELAEIEHLVRRRGTD
jgi:hypothetical protein